MKPEIEPSPSSSGVCGPCPLVGADLIDVSLLLKKTQVVPYSAIHDTFSRRTSRKPCLPKKNASSIPSRGYGRH
jgi:hypothetical protein